MTAKSINDWIKINPFELSQKLIGFIREVTQFDENIFIEGSIKITPSSLDCERLSCFTSHFDSKDERVIQLLNDLDANQSIKTSYNLMSLREVQSLGFGVDFSSECQKPVYGGSSAKPPKKENNSQLYPIMTNSDQ